MHFFFEANHYHYYQALHARICLVDQKTSFHFFFATIHILALHGASCLKEDQACFHFLFETTHYLALHGMKCLVNLISFSCCGSFEKHHRHSAAYFVRIDQGGARNCFSYQRTSVAFQNCCDEETDLEMVWFGLWSCDWTGLVDAARN